MNRCLWPGAASRLVVVSLGYLVLVVAGIAGGCAISIWQGHAAAAPRYAHRPQTDVAFLVGVLQANGRVWVYTCCGLVSFGVVGLFVLFGNAVRFGIDVTSLARGAPRELVYLLPHAVVEFAAFTVAAASCQYLAWCLFDVLVLNRARAPVRPGVQALAVSLVLLVVAACLETYSQSLRFG